MLVPGADRVDRSSSPAGWELDKRWVPRGWGIRHMPYYCVMSDHRQFNSIGISREVCVTNCRAKFVNSSVRLAFRRILTKRWNLCSLLSIHTTIQKDISYSKQLAVFHREMTLLKHNLQTNIYPLQILACWRTWPNIVVMWCWTGLVL